MAPEPDWAGRLLLLASLGSSSALLISPGSSALRIPPPASRHSTPRLSADSLGLSVLCVGETIFDGLPAGIFLGGAPLNVAVHLASLGADVAYVSAVGDDRLGAEALRRLQARGVDTALVSTVPSEETGFVTAEIDEATGDASYTFVTPAAWDYVPVTGVAAAAARADAVVFGTLAQRSEATAAAVMEAKASARFTVCDINIRLPYICDEVIAASAAGVDLLKLNDEELVPVAEALLRSGESVALAREALAAAEAAAEAAEAGAPDEKQVEACGAAAKALGRLTRSNAVAVTRGPRGAVLWEGEAAGEDRPLPGEGGELPTGEVWSCAGFAPPAIADTVGAGDAFLAACLVSRISGDTPSESLEAGCRLGAFVAGAQGATPRHDRAAVAALRAN